MNNTEIFNREIYPELVNELNTPYIIIITGSRRTGKTTLLRMLQEEASVKENNIYFDLENPVLRETFEQKNFDLIAKDILNRLNKPQKHSYILLDEIQYLSNPAGFLKYMFDHYPNFKFIVSGSSSLKIKSIFSDSMVGRKRLFRLFPLSFAEFLTFKGQEHLVAITQQIDFFSNSISRVEVSPVIKSELEAEFSDYLTYGGYPETTLLKTKVAREQSLYEFYSSYIQKDIAYLFSIENIDKFNKLVKLFASQIGSLVNASEIANTLAMSRLTVDKYSSLLSNTFVLDFLRPYYKNIRSELSKMPKLYFEDVGVCNAVLGNFNITDNSSFTGNLAENFVFNQLQKKYPAPIKFWRTKTKQEVNFILEDNSKIIPIEVKFQTMKRAKIPSGLKSFIERYNPPIAYVITRDLYVTEKYNGTRIQFLPIYLV